MLDVPVVDFCSSHSLSMLGARPRG
jgi:hypothetical protein